MPYSLNELLEKEEVISYLERNQKLAAYNAMTFDELHLLKRNMSANRYGMSTYQDRLDAAAWAAHGSRAAHVFYIWLGVYSIIELDLLNYTSDALKESCEEVFLPATLVLWCIWSAVDIIAVYLVQQQEEKNDNHALANINRWSSRQLLLGTVFTAVFIYECFGMEILAGGLGAAPLTFSICMFLTAWDAQRRIDELNKIHVLIADFSKTKSTLTLSNLYDENEKRNAQTADEIFEKLKELFIKYQIANPTEEKLDEALGNLTLLQIHNIFEQEMAFQTTARNTWLTCGVAMFGFALEILQISGLVMFTASAWPIVVGLIMASVFISVSARIYLKHQEGAVQNKIISIAQALPETRGSLNEEAGVKAVKAHAPLPCSQWEKFAK
ncbi:MAG: hypothetical protein WC748_10225, partial [Legionellales bacterium]